MAALNISNRTANFARIDVAEEENDAEEQVKDLQFAFMAFASSSSSEKFDVSSDVTESMIKKQLKWKENKGEGIRYSVVPPPYNDNYTGLPLSKEDEEMEKLCSMLKGIRCDNGTEFKNSSLNYFCVEKGVLQQYSSARTPQQNGVAERRNKNLIEAARTTLVYNKTIKQTMESYDLRWLEENETDARVGPDWLFNYNELFKPFNLFPVVDAENSDAGSSNTVDEEDNMTTDACCLSVAYPSESLDSAQPLSASQRESVTETVPSQESPEFEKLKVRRFFELPVRKKALDTIWIFRNKQDDTGVIIRNKVRLVVRVFQQVEGLFYTKLYAPMARLEAICIFLEHASYMGFTVYQMDVKTSFLYGVVKEEIYVDQPQGFVDSKDPTYVYKLDKPLYDLHQAPRSWYATLTTHLHGHGYKRGTIDQTFFLKTVGKDLILDQIYVDDIIFGSTGTALCR
ncbi:uncharacterized protein LOC143602045 [Bidens hawaiensis]|uniref:uncharacterized protein LOC143602045 n=1 Tax=Bidens hawaiensis TaxID=980011 RepID=UPI00404A10CB